MHRRAEALRGTHGEQHAFALGGRGPDRGQDEDLQADHEHALAAQQIGEPAAEQLDATEDDEAARDRPGGVAVSDSATLTADMSRITIS